MTEPKLINGNWIQTIAFYLEQTEPKNGSWLEAIAYSLANLPSTSGGTSATVAGSFGITIDGGGSAITAGVQGYVEVPYSGTITSWTLVSDQEGDCVIDVWKDTYANFPPTVDDTIVGSEKPTLSSSIKNQDNNLSTWTTTVNAGDIIAFNVDSASDVTKVTLSIKITK